MAANTSSGIPWRLIGWGGAALLLATPLVAMQFTDEVVWTPFDFAFMGILMGSIGLGLELAFRKAGDGAYRGGAIIALALTFLTIWINGAVGVIGSENEDANMLFLAVLATALVGAIAARFRPVGMAWAMTAAAVVQAAVPALAWVLTPEARPHILAREVFVLTLIFTALWLISAALFRKAARR